MTVHNWQNNLACEFITKNGYTVLDRVVCPVEGDFEDMIEIVAYDYHRDEVVFVILRHDADFAHVRPCEEITDATKRNNFKAACREWLNTNRWGGKSRVDIIHIYGCKESYQIDHLQNLGGMRVKAA